MKLLRINKDNVDDVCELLADSTVKIGNTIVVDADAADIIRGKLLVMDYEREFVSYLPEPVVEEHDGAFWLDGKPYPIMEY